MKACERKVENREGRVERNFLLATRYLPLSNKKNWGFTYIEMLIVVALVALCFVPLLQMFAKSVDEVLSYSTLGTAALLARDNLEEVKNYRLTKDQIKRTGEVWFPPEKEPPLEFNGAKWRIKRTAVSGTDPLEIRVDVYQADKLNKPLVELVTLIEDM